LTMTCSALTVKSPASFHGAFLLINDNCPIGQRDVAGLPRYDDGLPVNDQIGDLRAAADGRTTDCHCSLP
jgi:hypothetical protein